MSVTRARFYSAHYATVPERDAFLARLLEMHEDRHMSYSEIGAAVGGLSVARVGQLVTEARRAACPEPRR